MNITLIKEALVAWDKSLLTDAQLSILRMFYETMLDGMEIVPDQFGSLLIAAYRMKLMDVKTMIAARKRD